MTMTKEKWLGQRPVFTAKHYNKLWELLQKNFDSIQSTTCSEHRNFLLDLHDEIGVMFEEDNPRFKRNLWSLINQGESV